MNKPVGRRFKKGEAGRFDSSILKHRVSIEQKGTTKDALNQPVSGWVPYVNLSANVLFDNGKETIASGRDLSVTLASVRIRYRKDITTEMRGLFDGRVFDITSVLPSTDRDYVDLAVSFGLSNG